MAKKGSSGSDRHHEKVGPGDVAGAGEVAMGGPGTAAMRVKPHGSGRPQEAASGKSPAGMSTYDEE